VTASRSSRPLLLRTALLGLAAGGRSTSPLAALAWTSRAIDVPPFSGLAGTRGRAVATTAALGEVVVDKLPQTPSRLALPPLLGRVVSGAAGGVGLASRTSSVPLRALPPTALLPAILVGGGAAIAGSYLGSAWRRVAPFDDDLPAALLEDAVVMLLSWSACSR
jgi:uncharacterized membrane protein